MNADNFQKRQRPPIPSVVDSFTGIIPFTAETETERCDPDVFVVSAGTADTTVYGFPHKVSSNGSGAGLTFRDAYRSAIGEGIERYASSIIHSEDLILGSYNKLHQQGCDLISPDRWALFHPNQYEHIPFAPFCEDTPITWVRAKSLICQQERLVPACMIYISYYPHFIKDGEKVIATAISTGAACASSRIEALLKGTCELVERDAFMIMWRNRLPLSRVCIDSRSSLHSIFEEKFSRPGLEYTLIYTTLDLSIPSFFGILLDTRHKIPSIVVGGAAHLDPCQAALKTLFELVQ
jgi:ribosomal protein S12 methylthiotransferase accessory factor